MMGLIKRYRRIIGAIAAFLLLVIGATIALGRESRFNPWYHDSMTATGTVEGDQIRVYVITDPDTGYHYLVSDRGGICRREGIEWEVSNANQQ